MARNAAEATLASTSVPCGARTVIANSGRLERAEALPALDDDVAPVLLDLQLVDVAAERDDVDDRLA